MYVCILLGKTQVPHRIDKTLDKSLYRGGNPHLTSWFCEDELGLKFQHIYLQECIDFYRF